MDLWVFGYGSLLWDPGFEPAEAVQAELAGFHRSFCMLSFIYRGTETAPGLVLALDAVPGGLCEGVAFRLPDENAPEIMAKLRARELVSPAYLESQVTVSLADGRSVTALAYVIDRTNRQYCHFDLETQATMIASARGARGTNAEYLFNTTRHLASLGIRDPDMDWLVTRVMSLNNAARQT